MRPRWSRGHKCGRGRSLNEHVNFHVCVVDEVFEDVTEDHLRSRQRVFVTGRLCDRAVIGQSSSKNRFVVERSSSRSVALGQELPFPHVRSMAVTFSLNVHGGVRATSNWKWIYVYGSG